MPLAPDGYGLSVKRKAHWRIHIPRTRPLPRKEKPAGLPRRGPENVPAPFRSVLEELPHGELEAAAVAVALAVLVKRDAVGEAQIAHG